MSIKSFKDLEVYQESYTNCMNPLINLMCEEKRVKLFNLCNRFFKGFFIFIHKNLIPKLPVEEKYDLSDQLLVPDTLSGTVKVNRLVKDLLFKCVTMRPAIDNIN